MKNKIQTYIRLNDEFEDLSRKIGNYLDTKPAIWDSCYDAFEKFEIDDNKFIIYFYDSHYDLYDCCSFGIPLSRIIDDTWKEYIDEEEDKKLQKRYDEMVKTQKRAEDERRKLYEELKEEFENK